MSQNPTVASPTLAAPTLSSLREGFATPPSESRPMMRWWWFGPTVEKAELDRELTAMAAAGLGGVEVSYVYPLESASTPPAPAAFLSDSFLDNLRYAAERASELGLRFDLTLGSGWSFGGPHITADLAARQLHWERREIGPQAMDVPLASTWPGDELIAAFIGNGSIQERPENLTELPIDPPDVGAPQAAIRVPAGQGPRVVLLAYSRLTGQNVKRAAGGAEGPVLDHYCVAAAQAQIEAVAEPLLRAVSPELVGSVFCDSLEVYSSDWTPGLLAEFERRCGYPLRPRLYQLLIDSEGADLLRADFYRTLSALYEENFVAVFQRWAAGQGVPFRIQSYGVPPATVSSYRHADIVEGEGWDWQGIPQTRWASSAARIYDRDVVSAEVWTWVHSPSFRATPLDLLGEAHEHLLAGVNHLIGHGWPYSPSEAPGLGWFFYASGALDDRNPWWPAMPSLAGYLQRLCWLLRQGRPVRDILIYVPASDVFADTIPGLRGTLDLWKGTREHIGPDIPRVIRQSGLDFDLVDDTALEVLSPEDAPIVLLPHTTLLPKATAEWLDRVRAAGGTVLAVDSADDLSTALLDATPADVALQPHYEEIGVVHRRIDDLDVYVVINTGPSSQNFRFTTRSTHQSFEEWDASTGSVRRSGLIDAGIDLELHPYQATVIVTSGTAQQTVPRQTGGGLDVDEVSTSLAGPWTVAFAETEPVPVNLPHRWDDEVGREGYSGAVTYATSFQVEHDDLTGRFMIDFGPCSLIDPGSTDQVEMRGNSYRVKVTPPLGETGEVIVNGVSCGVLWAPPYEIDVTDAIRAGHNDLQVIVRNTAANALSQEQHIETLVETTTERYGRRFRMQDLERAREGLASGLLAQPSLVIRT